MQYFIITAKIDRVTCSVTRQTESKQVFWNSRTKSWTEERYLAKRYASHKRAESVANKLSTKRARNITVEECVFVEKHGQV